MTVRTVVVPHEHQPRAGTLLSSADHHHHCLCYELCTLGCVFEAVQHEVATGCTCLLHASLSDGRRSPRAESLNEAQAPVQVLVLVPVLVPVWAQEEPTPTEQPCRRASRGYLGG